MSLGLQVVCDELKYLTKLKGDSGIFQPGLCVYIFQCVKMEKSTKGLMPWSLVISPVRDVFTSPHRPKLTTPASLELDTHRPSGQVSWSSGFFLTVLCNNNPKTMSIVAWYIIRHVSLQEWSSPSQVWLTGRTWTVVDTKSDWDSSWRRKDSTGVRTRKATQEKNKEPKCENTTKVHSATRTNTSSLWVLHTYAHVLWP